MIMIEYRTLTLNYMEILEVKNEVKEKSKISNEALDAIAAVIIIGVAVVGMVYWLSGMPS